MSQVTAVKTTTLDVPLESLLIKVLERRQANDRLVQICCAVIDNQYELLYTFSDDEAWEVTNLKVTCSLTAKIPSITRIYPYATFYENEMAELFGVPVEMIQNDYHGKFYRIGAKDPFLKASEKAQKEKEEEAPKTKICPYCKSEIDIEATRCPHCTSELPKMEPVSKTK